MFFTLRDMSGSLLTLPLKRLRTPSYVNFHHPHDSRMPFLLFAKCTLADLRGSMGYMALLVICFNAIPLPPSKKKKVILSSLK